MTIKGEVSAIVILLIIQVTLALDPIAAIVKDSPVVDAQVGSTLEIRCDVSSRPSDITVRWSRETYNCTEEEPVPCRRDLAEDRLPYDQQKYGLKFVTSDTYILIIKYVDETDDGRYLCYLTVTQLVKSYDIISVRVVDPPSIDPMVTSSDLYVAEDDRVELTCGAFGIPEPQIRWSRAGNGMMPGGGFIRIGSKLTISKMNPEFRGPYICTAINDVGEAHRTINIDMSFAPEVSGSPAQVSQKVGYTTKLICHVNAKPTATISWYVDGDEVTDQSSRFELTTYESAFGKVISKLTIPAVRASDYSSEFTCRASNNKGNTEVIFQVLESLTVQLVPGASSPAALCLPSLQLLLLTLLAGMAVLI